MKIIPPSAFAAMPWKNGGGVTHEILKEERDGKLLLRLSIAEVVSDGPFSLFPGLSRILTVIEGRGLELSAPGRLLQALPLQPIAFSGDWPVTCRRLDGDVRDFNMIFDARALTATVRIHAAGESVTLSGDGLVRHAVLLLGQGTVNGVSLEPGALLCLDDGAATITCAASLLQVMFQRR